MNFEQIIQTITLKAVSTLDIEQAFINTRTELSKWMPADELFIFRLSDDDNRIFILARISADGSRSMDPQLLLDMNEEEKKFRDETLLRTENPYVVLRRCDMPMEGSSLRQASNMERFGLSVDTDDMVLFNSHLKAGIGVLSYAPDCYTLEHVRLFEALSEPFYTAISNAMRYQELQRDHNALVDDNLLFREVTVRLTGETHIAKAFKQTIDYLAGHIPLKAMPIT
ncbi:MAG: hypothetical protein JXR76_06530 [Deltaproteobacteria bacterium]|nr:hypothetical protein [Deltaproteobacteria bacterium]